MPDDRDVRAKRLAAGLKAAASTKGGLVRFGLARNLGKPAVAIPAEEFDAMTDAAATERLRRAWGL